MRIAFLGTGSITSAVVTGLCTAPVGRQLTVQVSPRNPARAAALADRFEQVSVARDNQSLLDACDTVFLAVRPAVAPGILEALKFRADHRVVSLIPTLRVAQLEELIAPAHSPQRITPLPPCARGRGAVVTYRTDAAVTALLRPLGELLAVDSERELHLLIATTALVSPLYTVLADAAAWARAGGVDGEVAERYVAGMAAAICQDRLDDASPSLLELATEAATPGGLNESARAAIADAGGFATFGDALDAIAHRLQETPPNREATP